MKKIVLIALLLALTGGAYFWFKSKQSSQNSSESLQTNTSGSASDTGAPPPQEPSATEQPAPGTEVHGGPGYEGGAPGKTVDQAGGVRPPSVGEETEGQWIQGSIGLRGDHIQAVDSFVSAVEERIPDSLTRFFSDEMKNRKSVAGRGKLKSFIKQSLMGEGFFGGLTNPDTRKIRSVREGAFHLTVKFEVSNPQNDEQDIPVTVKFQFESINGNYVITQVSETRG
ncbi:MAG: hypothetical protein KGP28_11505 [Bdellovibrionales bacterium]|nr:hypothetical protein [Bdellovibrionales bacterium]